MIQEKISHSSYATFMLKELIPLTWKAFLSSEVDKEYFREIDIYLQQEIAFQKSIHPDLSSIFKAFEICNLKDVKVIILGQDPYHGRDQAMGLSFSVPKGLKIPPSLRNIFKEIMSDLNIEYPFHGDLTSWAKQGVLLLNSILTVEHQKPASHSKIGWEKFTDHVIKKLSTEKENLVFLLWGNFAIHKKNLIDERKHLILEAAHPSPLARNKFMGCRHFSKTNEYLLLHHKKPIEWKLSLTE